jgi:hypothetical protein
LPSLALPQQLVEHVRRAEPAIGEMQVGIERHRQPRMPQPPLHLLHLGGRPLRNCAMALEGAMDPATVEQFVAMTPPWPNSAWK